MPGKFKQISRSTTSQLCTSAEPKSTLYAKSMFGEQHEQQCCFCQIEHRDTYIKCCHCNTYMILEEQIAQSCCHNPHFQLCCKEGKINLLSIQPPSAECMAFQTENTTKQNTFEDTFAHITMHLLLHPAGPTLIKILPIDKKKIYRYDKKKIYIYDTYAQVNYQLNLNDAFSAPIVQMLT